MFWRALVVCLSLPVFAQEETLRADCGQLTCTIIKEDLIRILKENMALGEKLLEQEKQKPKCAEVIITEPSKKIEIPKKERDS